MEATQFFDLLDHRLIFFDSDLSSGNLVSIDPENPFPGSLIAGNARCRVLENQDTRCVLLLDGMSGAFLQAWRQAIMERLPVLKVIHVSILKNTTTISDSLIEDKVKRLFVCGDPHVLREHNEKHAIRTGTNAVRFRLRRECKLTPYDTSPDGTLRYKVSEFLVRAGDFVYDQDPNDPVDVHGNPIKFRMAHPKEPLFDLDVGESLELEVYVGSVTGYENEANSNVRLAFLSYCPPNKVEIEIQTSESTESRAVATLPQDLFFTIETNGPWKALHAAEYALSLIEQNIPK